MRARNKKIAKQKKKTKIAQYSTRSRAAAAGRSEDFPGYRDQRYATTTILLLYYVTGFGAFTSREVCECVANFPTAMRLRVHENAVTGGKENKKRIDWNTGKPTE